MAILTALKLSSPSFMPDVLSSLLQLTHWYQPYYSEIALTAVAFVLVCVFGYGLLIVFPHPISNN